MSEFMDCGLFSFHICADYELCGERIEGFMEDEALRIFIKQFELSQELWDCANEKYSNKTARIAALDRLIPILRRIRPGAKREDVKKKINSLRTNFRKELKKIATSKRSGKSTDEVYKPSARTYYALSFLERSEKPVQQQPSEAEAEEPIPIHEEAEAESALVRKRLQQECYSSISSVIPSPVSRQTPQNKKPRMQGPIAKENELLQKACSYLENSANPDHIPTIAKAWGEKLLTLDAKQRQFAEKAINDVLFEASLGTLHRNSIKINEVHQFPSSLSSTQPETSLGSTSSSSIFNYNFSSHKRNSQLMNNKPEDLSFEDFKF